MDLLLAKRLVYVSHPSPHEASVPAGALPILGQGQESRKEARSLLPQYHRPLEKRQVRFLTSEAFQEHEEHTRSSPQEWVPPRRLGGFRATPSLMGQQSLDASVRLAHSSPRD